VLPVVRRREIAKRDLIEHFVFIGENQSIERARRFRRCAEEAFFLLAENPEKGRHGHSGIQSTGTSGCGRYGISRSTWFSIGPSGMESRLKGCWLHEWTIDVGWAPRFEKWVTVELVKKPRSI